MLQIESLQNLTESRAALSILWEHFYGIDTDSAARPISCSLKYRYCDFYHRQLRPMASLPLAAFLSGVREQLAILKRPLRKNSARAPVDSGARGSAPG